MVGGPGRLATRPWFAAAVVPLLQVLGYGLMSRAFGPFWVGGAVDPTYAYVLNALLLAEGRAPFLSEHPGITVEALGALGIHAVHALVGGASSLRDDVLTHPERVAVTITVMLVAAMAAANTFQGWAVHKLTGSWACMATAQLAPFLPATVLGCGIQVMAEPLLLALGLLLSGGVALCLSRDGSSGAGWGSGLGVILALGVATKLLFAPLVVLPLVVLRGARARLVFAGAAVLTLAASLLPLAPRLAVTAAYYGRLATHTGAYGRGEPGLLDPGATLDRVSELVAAEPFAHMAALLGGVVSVVAFFRSGSGSRVRRLAAVLAAIALAELLVEAATAKHPPVRAYYLTSAIATLGLSLALVLAITAAAGARAGERRAGQAVVAVLLLLGVALQAHTAFEVIAERQHLRAGLATSRIVEELGGDRVIQGSRVSSVASALEFGNSFAGSAFSADLRRLYPKAVFFDGRGIHAFGELLKRRRLRALADPDGALLFWDSPSIPLSRLEWPAGAAVETLDAVNHESLRRLRALPVPGTAESAPAIPAMAGVLVLAGPQFWVTESGLIPRPGLAPPTRLAFGGRRGPEWLVAETRYSGEGTQVLSVFLNGRKLGRYELAPGDWTRLTIPLPALPGLNEIAIEYDRVWDGGPWPPPGSPPAQGPGRDHLRLVGVSFRRLQIVEDPASASSRLDAAAGDS